MRNRTTISPVADEIANTLAWGGIGSLIGGVLLAAIWAVFEFVDIAQLYVHYASPLLSETLLTLMLIIGAICLANFVVSMIGIGLVNNNRLSAKNFALVSAALQIWLPPTGTFFGVTLLSMARAWPAAANAPDKAIDDKTAKDLLVFNAVYCALTVGFLLLMIPIAYFLPVEFANDEELFWLRLNIWNIFYAVNAVEVGIAVLLSITAWMAKNEKNGWKPLLWTTCILMIFAIPIGPYLAGVFYRNLLRSQPQATKPE
nr:hypothetical protein [Candidatus Sigynarchaeota archaeon]